MKMRWEEPRVEIQKFIPNEYVAACYVINCNVPGTGTLYAESNGVPGLQTRNNYWEGYDADRRLIGGVQACHEWHKGVIQDNAPTANGYWVQSRWGDDEVTEVYWWRENLGSTYDIHATTIMDQEWETNPNAS